MTRKRIAAIALMAAVLAAGLAMSAFAQAPLQIGRARRQQEDGHSIIRIARTDLTRAFHVDVEQDVTAFADRFFKRRAGRAVVRVEMAVVFR